VKRSKAELTQHLLELLECNPTEYKSAFGSWWYNTRDLGGWRLTATGFTILKQLEFEFWNFELPEDWQRHNKRVMLGLDRKLSWPYYYGKHRISFFNSKDAMMLNLVGNVEEWLANNFDQ